MIFYGPINAPMTTLTKSKETITPQIIAPNPAKNTIIRCFAETFGAVVLQVIQKITTIEIIMAINGIVSIEINGVGIKKG